MPESELLFKNPSYFCQLPFKTILVSTKSYPTRSSDISKSPFSNTPSSNYPIPKVGKISSVLRPVTPVITIPSISPCLPRHIESTLITGDHDKTKTPSLPTPNPSQLPPPHIPQSAHTSANMGHKHAQEILGKSNKNIQFTLRPNSFNSLHEFGTKGKNTTTLYIFHPRHREGHHRLPKSPPSTNISHRHETIYPDTMSQHLSIIT